MARNIYLSSCSLHTVSEFCLYAQKVIYQLNGHAMITINLIVSKIL